MRDGQERGFPTSDADQRIAQIREENAVVTESLPDVTYWKLTVLTARCLSTMELKGTSWAGLIGPRSDPDLPIRNESAAPRRIGDSKDEREK